MIIGIGMDIIELERIEGSVKRNSRFPDRILTEKEKEQYAMLANDRRRAEYLAGRFAAKEAFSKACGRGIGAIGFRDVEIIRNENGAPKIRVPGYEQMNLFVSITHSRDYAAAQVLIEEKN
ncbi:holo-ACP synthase [Lentibacillus cibarius]|uniref:Holo-[acyl-carrier-protein] synthase n=1 Tax=Lentibacillus cibarius TaxID=2583219 RepID=A0A549YHK2_9BACI|nr:holo-ACP synthase [Lentibacillus cibarius]TRM11363.1 holo-ACP synthase [Lentibacillus cibarius]